MRRPASVLRGIAPVLALSAPGFLAAQVVPPATGEQPRGPQSSHSIAISPDGRYALVGHETGTMKLWDLSTGAEAAAFGGHGGAVVAVAFSPDGRQLLSGSTDSTVRLWDAATRSEVRSFTGHTGTVFSVAFGRDGSHVLSGSADTTMRLWETSSGRLVRTFRGHGGYAGSVVLFSPDGRHVLMGNTLWNASSGEEIRRFGTTGRYGYWKDSARFTEDGEYLWMGETLYEVATGNAVVWLVGSIRTTLHNVFDYSPDGAHVVGGGGGNMGTASVWNTGHLRNFDPSRGPVRLRPWSGLTTASLPVTAVAFSPDGRLLLVRTLYVPERPRDNLTLFDVSNTDAPLSSFTAR